MEQNLEANGQKEDGNSRYAVVFLYAVAFRLAVYAVSGILMLMLGKFENGFSLQALFDNWSRWDSPHYIDLAQYGYSGATENGKHLFLVFYPLLPWILRILHLVIRNYVICGILVNILCFAGGSLYFYRLTELEYGREAAEKAVVLMGVFPFAFFYGAVLTESLFYFVSAAFFYYLRRHRWAAVTAFGFLACLTKTQGLMLTAAVAMELFYSEKIITCLRKRQFAVIWKRIILPGMLCALMVLGTFLYMGINLYVEGDPFRFMQYQSEHWHHEFVPIWNTIAYIWQNIKIYSRDSLSACIWLPEFVLFFVWTGSIILGIVKRMRPGYVVYSILCLFVTYSISWLISGGRYSLCVLPGFMLLGKMLVRRERTYMAVVILSTLLMTVYMTGFLTGKQIM